MNTFFYPESLAVVGVSLRKMNLGKIILLNNARCGYRGALYGVGSEAGSLEGIPVFEKVADIPAVPDVVIIITPAVTVPPILEECGKKGVRRVVVESGGFSEYRHDGKNLEKEVLDIAERYGMKIIGPNCIGTINFEIHMMMPFAFFNKEYPTGSVSIISQSGGVGNTLLQALPDNHIFVAKFAAVGNKLQLDEADFTEYFLGDEKTKIVVEYLEGFSRGREFFKAARNSEKPVIVLKSNRSELSRSIAQSHTTALSSSDDVVDAALSQAAVIRVTDEEELISAAKIMGLPPMKSRRVAVLSRSGGHAVLTADACAEYGFEMVAFPESFYADLKAIYKTRVINHQNPLDLGEIFDYTIFTKILDLAMQLENVDGVIFNHLYQSTYEREMSRMFLDSVDGLVKKYGKPVSVALISDAAEVTDLTINHSYPIFKTPREATWALSVSADYFEKKRKLKNRGMPEHFPVDHERIGDVVRLCRQEGRMPLLDESLAISGAAGILPVRGVKINSSGDAIDTGLKPPLAVKLLSRDASHKSDVGGVRLNLGGAEEATRAVREIEESINRSGKRMKIDGFFVHEMAPGGTEFFVGGRQDPVFGPVVLAGLGGVFIELFRDRAIRLAPVAREEATDMLKSLKAYPLLRGFRGSKPLDTGSLVDIILKISWLMASTPEIMEIDLNPVIVYPEGQGAAIVDSRVFFSTVGQEVSVPV